MAFIIKSSLPKQYKEKWKRQFVDQDREYLESIWRRSEDAENLNDLSSRRRRIIHVIDKYALLKNKDKYDFAIVDCYMWLCSTLPREEMARYIKRIESAC